MNATIDPRPGLDPDFTLSIDQRHERRPSRPTPNQVGVFLERPDAAFPVPCAATHRSAAMVVNIETLVVEGAAALEPGDITETLRLLPNLRRKAASIAPAEAPHLPAQWLFLGAAAEDAASNRYTHLPEAAFREAVYAIRYGLKTIDLIPDTVEDIGFADDSRVAVEVLRRHEPHFTRYAHRFGIDWSKVTTRP
jgi:hypothetical protein